MTINRQFGDGDAYGARSSAGPAPYVIDAFSEPDDAISPDHVS